ncbi:MAG: sigma-54-dependent Fis family transcriptional regulator [Myxococcales bacterium]|nr:sigma-54-dependent Fis family transcriptional regulator [Myxococcales bacterium]
MSLSQGPGDGNPPDDQRPPGQLSASDALLFSLGEAVITEISTGELLRRVVDVLTESLAADRGTIYVFDEKKDELRSVAAHLPELPTIRVPIGQGVAGFVARSRQLVNIDHANRDQRFWNNIDKRTGYVTRCMLAAPIQHRDGTLLGVLQLLNKRNGTFTGEDEDTLRLLSEQLAQLLEKSTVTATLKRSALPELSTGSRKSKRGKLSTPEVDVAGGFNHIIGAGAQIQNVFRSIRRVAPTDATVLVTGDSGTGKGRVARALHHNSLRADGTFVHVDCASLPEGVMERELFGAELRSDSKPPTIKPGRVELADGGTLLLDEVADLPLSAQGKLLGLLQHKTFTRVRGSTTLSANIRVIATTNRDLPRLVSDGRFREDLYYRLRVVQIELPPLRKRGIRDLRLLVDHFLANAARRHRRTAPQINAEAMRCLVNYSWPGNVRELENCIESAVILADEVIYAHNLPLPRSANPHAGADGGDLGRQGDLFAQQPTMSELEARYISYLLSRHKGNRSAIAGVLGIGRNTLLRKIRGYGLE